MKLIFIVDEHCCCGWWKLLWVLLLNRKLLCVEFYLFFNRSGVALNFQSHACHQCNYQICCSVSPKLMTTSNYCACISFVKAYFNRILLHSESIVFESSTSILWTCILLYKTAVGTDGPMLFPLVMLLVTSQ